MEELITLAGNTRPPLEGARDELVSRLHRCSDDFDAAWALKLVEYALRRVGWGANVLPELRAPNPGAAGPVPSP